MRIIRWLLVPVAAAAAWAMSLSLGLMLHGAATILCPESQMVSGACVAPWWRYADAAVVSVSAAVAAAAVAGGAYLAIPGAGMAGALVLRKIRT